MMKQDDHLLYKVVGVQELSLYLNLSPRRIQQLAQRGIIPEPANRGRYNLLLSLHGYIQYLRQQVAAFSGMQGGLE